jgi:hypothetical protein
LSCSITTPARGVCTINVSVNGNTAPFVMSPTRVASNETQIR